MNTTKHANAICFSKNDNKWPKNQPKFLNYSIIKRYFVKSTSRLRKKSRLKRKIVVRK